MKVSNSIMISIARIILILFKKDLLKLSLKVILLKDCICFSQITMPNLIVISINSTHHQIRDLFYLQHTNELFHLGNENPLKLMQFMVVKESILLSFDELLLLIQDQPNLQPLEIIIMHKVMFCNDVDISLIKTYPIKYNVLYLMKQLIIVFINRQDLQFLEFDQYLCMDKQDQIYHYFLYNNQQSFYLI